MLAQGVMLEAQEAAGVGCILRPLAAHAYDIALTVAAQHVVDLAAPPAGILSACQIPAWTPWLQQR